jgi:TolB-like protein/Flp pilus assembly protein TadD
MSSFLAEMKRRNVFRVVGVYAVSSWVLAQLAGVLESAMNLPPWFDTMVVSLLLIGFPIALILAWAFEMTPEGVKRTEAATEDEIAHHKKAGALDYVLIAGLVLVAVLVIGDRIMPKETSEPATATTTIAETTDATETTSADSQILEGQSIAVLPFEDFSADKDQAYFADGIAEELLNVLARVDGLRVASRTSAFSFKEREMSIKEIAQALNVNHILEGSVRKAGDTLRITAQLIDTDTDQHLWSETYDRPLTAENIFVIQDEISKAIVLELNGRLDLLPETSDRLTQSTEALEAYLKGKEAYGPRNADGIELGITELIRAVTLDPEFSVAHAKLSRAYVLASTYGELAVASAAPRAQIHMNRAMALAPDDWDVLSDQAWWLEAQRSNYGAQDVTTEQVVAAFDAAIAANPNNAEAHRGKGWTLLNADRLEEARPPLERALELNPREMTVYLNLGGLARRQNRYDEAKKLMLEAVRQSPEATAPRISLALIYMAYGNLETAHRILQSCRTKNSCAARLGNLYVSLGIDNEDSRLLDDYTLLSKHYLAGDFDQFAQIVSTLDGTPPLVKSEMYAYVGRWDEAYKIMQENPALFEPMLQGLAYSDSLPSSEEIALLATLDRQDDPRAKAFRASLAERYQDVVPSEGMHPDLYFNGATWQMLEDNPDGAMVWLNALAERGISYQIGPFPIFEPLKPRADYQAFLARMDSYTDRDRALIEAQLANPPAVWWSPDEMPEDPEEDKG